MLFTMQSRVWKAISIGNLLYNFNQWKGLLPGSIRHLIGVVKADAYGHGAIPISQALVEAGMHALAVANVEEGMALRTSGIEIPILVLSDPLPGEEESFVACHLQATASSLETLQRLQHVASKHQQPIEIQLKIDTGMGRQGVWHEAAVELYQAILANPSIQLKGIYSHFSCAHHDEGYTEMQRQRFSNFISYIGLNQLPQMALHIDNSPGSLQSVDRPFLNAVRCGSLLLGRHFNAPWLKPISLKPVLSFHARVLAVKTLPKGLRLGYGGGTILHRPTRIAILSAGYAHGLPQWMDKGEVLIHGVRCPVFNPISMDQSMADVTDLEAPIHPGETATWIGSEGNDAIGIEEFATKSHQYPLEALCRLNAPGVATLILDGLK
jgi:alanine racemase